MSFFLFFFPEHLFSYRFCLFFFPKHLFLYRFRLFFIRNLCSHIVFVRGEGGRNLCSHIVFDWFISEHWFYFHEDVLILAWCFLEHVFPGYRFVSSSLVFVEPRVLILEIRIIFRWGGGGGFRTRIPRLHVCIAFNGFIGSRVFILETVSF